MTDAFIADASVGIAWVHPNQGTDVTQEWLSQAEAGSAVYVASLWPLEIANALLVAVRRNRMTHAHRANCLSFLARLDIHVDGQAGTLAWSSISDTAVTYNLTVYDAAYLELAVRKQLPLATRDGALRVAAQQAGVKVL